MRFSSRIVHYVVFLSTFLNCFVVGFFAQPQKPKGSPNDKCLVRDGRDGVPGPPGMPGRQGLPGRDGRDCSVNWSLKKVFEMEKKLRDLDSKYNSVITEVQEMKKEVERSNLNTQRLLRIVDSDTTLKDKNDIIAMGRDSETRPVSFTPTIEKSTVAPMESFVMVEANVSPACKKQLIFHTHHTVETSGAVKTEVFKMQGNTYLAVANFYDEDYHTQSFIYQINPNTGNFEFLQTLPTIGCRSITFFSEGGNSYLFTANHFNGTNYEIESYIFKWNGTEFVKYVSVKTQGASGAEFFNINGENFLAIVNYRNDTSVSISSVLYKWNGEYLEVFQKFPTSGAVDCKFHSSEDGTLFLVFANHFSPSEGYDVKSVVYVWNGKQFTLAQSLSTSAAKSVDMFEWQAGLFLALASYRVTNSWHSITNVFRWNGTSFILFQELETTGASQIHHFIFGGSLHLAIANYFDEANAYKALSMIYRYDEKQKRFRKFQGIATTGAYDLRPFFYRGAPYLASAFHYNGKTRKLQSKVYKLYHGCVGSQDALP